MPSALREGAPRRTPRRRPLALAILDDGRHQHEIAAAAGISAPTLSGILTGRIADPRADTRIKLAQALDKPVDELFPEYAASSRSSDAARDSFEPDETAEVRDELIAQGVPVDLTSEQERFIGAVVMSDLRRRRARDAGAA